MRWNQLNFGEKIKKLRTEKGWTQEFVAEQLNISIPALSRYESGTYEPKSLAIISNFAKLYHVTSDYLLGLETNLDSNTEDFAFYEGYKDIDEEDKEILRATLRAIQAKKRKEKK